MTKNIVPEIYEVKNKIKSFQSNYRGGKGFGGKAFTDIVNIGIEGLI
jgi:glucose-6-phosphate isomerase